MHKGKVPNQIMDEIILDVSDSSFFLLLAMFKDTNKLLKSQCIKLIKFYLLTFELLKYFLNFAFPIRGLISKNIGINPH